MDSRLFTVDGQRLTRVRREDLPLLARSIVGVMKGKGHAAAGIVRGVECVRLKGVNFDIFVVKEDWRQIQPLIEQGAFNSFEYPKVPPGAYLNPIIAHDLPLLDGPDRAYFLYVFGQLWQIFKETWPT